MKSYELQNQINKNILKCRKIDNFLTLFHESKNSLNKIEVYMSIDGKCCLVNFNQEKIVNQIIESYKAEINNLIIQIGGLSVGCENDVFI